MPLLPRRPLITAFAALAVFGIGGINALTAMAATGMSSDNPATYLSFTASGTEMMRLTSTSVGIGKIPAQTFDVNGTAAAFSFNASNISDGLRLSGAQAFTATGSTVILASHGSWTDVSLRTGSIDRLHITATGSVGIGTTSPDAKLKLYTDSSGLPGNYLYVQSAHPTAWGETGIAIQTPQNYWSLWMSDGNNTGLPDSALSFYSGDAGGEVLTLLGSGFVGIGTTSPKATLDVNGYAKLKTNSSAPVACSATYKGSIAYTGTTTNYLCFCDGTSWKQAHSPATACTW